MALSLCRQAHARLDVRLMGLGAVRVPSAAHVEGGMVVFPAFEHQQDVALLQHRKRDGLSAISDDLDLVRADQLPGQLQCIGHGKRQQFFTLPVGDHAAVAVCP